MKVCNKIDYAENKVAVEVPDDTQENLRSDNQW